MVKVLGKTNIHLKVDCAEAEVEALIVPNMAQEIPVMIGQTFLNNSKVVMLVFDGNVRLLCMDHDIGKSLNLATVKIPLWAKNSTVIAANTTALVAVSSRGKFTGDLYVRGRLRPVPGNEYAVNECVTKGQEGSLPETSTFEADYDQFLETNRFPEPTDVRSVRQFLGLAGYFRKYIKDFAIIARPLTNLTKKDVSFAWGEDQHTAFQSLKTKLTSRPLLAIYDPELKTEVHTDASKVGIGGILLQAPPNGMFRPVMYYSRQTTKEEQRYHSYELETMAMVYRLKAFRIYLMGIQFKVVTDCNAIRTTLTKRDLVPRIGRWWLAIQEYKFDV
ncbi:RNase H-like domain found in reverse transcriptase [Popillia japonica]|uniref:RNase H-like domain found in reverse transcriptase n=1 Tax=Popillia japonica TaxID=7064 RepID=A0AAW1N4F1_POPJA